MLKFLTYSIVLLLPSVTIGDGLYLKSGIGLNNIKTTKFSNHKFEGKVKLSDNSIMELGLRVLLIIISYLEHRKHHLILIKIYLTYPVRQKRII
jgi:hypothetical protein